MEDLEWYGIDWYAPLSSDDGLTTVKINDVLTLLGSHQEVALRNLDPLTPSSSFGIDVHKSFEFDFISGLPERIDGFTHIHTCINIHIYNIYLSG